MQSIKEIEEHYNKPDPWHYQTSKEDLKRKNRIIDVCNKYGPFERALDIGCGEGWITQHLPAKEIHGFEVSAQARERFPKNVLPCVVPRGTFDLVVATGVMYVHYNWQLFLQIMHRHSRNIIVTSNIKDWEVPAMRGPENKDEWGYWLHGKQIYEETFPYREYTQQLRVFKI